MHGHLALAVAQDLPHIIIEAKHVSRDIKLLDSNVEEILFVHRYDGRRRRCV
jgi:hypothetical protein